MRALPSPTRLLNASAVILLTTALAGCRTNRKEREELAESLTTRDARPDLQFPAPPDGTGSAAGWTQVPRADGVEYVQGGSGNGDVVRLLAYSSPAGSVRTMEDLEQMLRPYPERDARRMERGEVAGVPVIRFEEAAEVPVSPAARLDEQFAGGPRATRTILRTRGVLLLRPSTESSPGEIVTMAVSRANARGEIGAHYEAVFEAWLNEFAGRQMR